MRRLPLLAPTLALMAVLLVVGPALSALRIGTNGSETLTGTKGNDHITGAGGDDMLKGLAGNDTYFFASGWGADTLIEKPGQGTDTLNFRGVTGNGLFVGVVREWTASVFFAVWGPGSESITFSNAGGIAQIERVIGGRGDGDDIYGGGGAHTLMPGGGAGDNLTDYGGWNDGPAGRPEIPASNDTYKGFADNTGTVLVQDWGAPTWWTCALSPPMTSTSVVGTSTPAQTPRRRVCRS